MPNRSDITGMRFGRLIVLGKAEPRGRNGYWRCRCDCGNLVEIRTQHLQKGVSSSCGCFRTELSTSRVMTHGGCYSPEYRSFAGAKTRCTNPHSDDYPNYGGRGIEFKFGSFEEFLAEVGPRPSAKHSIDRIDVDGHYKKGNLRWATPKEQRANQRRSKSTKPL